MSSLHLQGDFIKFAANNHCLPSASGRFYCDSTGYVAAPRRYLAVYLLTSVNTVYVVACSMLVRQVLQVCKVEQEEKSGVLQILAGTSAQTFSLALGRLELICEGNLTYYIHE